MVIEQQQFKGNLCLSFFALADTDNSQRSGLSTTHDSQMYVIKLKKIIIGPNTTQGEFRAHNFFSGFALLTSTEFLLYLHCMYQSRCSIAVQSQQTNFVSHIHLCARRGLFHMDISPLRNFFLYHHHYNL